MKKLKKILMLHISYFGDPEYSGKKACLSNDTPTQVASEMLNGQAVLLATTVKRFAVKKEDLNPYRKGFTFF